MTLYQHGGVSKEGLEGHLGHSAGHDHNNGAVVPINAQKMHRMNN